MEKIILDANAFDSQNLRPYGRQSFFCLSLGSNEFVNPLFPDTTNSITETDSLFAANTASDRHSVSTITALGFRTAKKDTNSCSLKRGFSGAQIAPAATPRKIAAV